MKFLLSFGFILWTLVSYSQVDSIQPPYKRFPTLPPIQILLSDSSTIYTKAQIPKKTPVLFLIFSPDCSHCQKEAEELTEYKEKMKDLQIILITMHPLWMMNDFIVKYKLNELPNVIVGKDINYLMQYFYDIHNLPFLSMYNEKGNLIRVFEGSLPIPNIIQVFDTNK